MIVNVNSQVDRPLRRRLDTATRRGQIARAVLDAVHARGVRGLSVGAVARRVGIAPSAIYRHYPSKEAMLDAVVELVRERTLANLAAARAGSPDALGALEDLLARHIRLIRENQALPRLLFSEDFYAGRPARRLNVLSVLLGFADGIAELIRLGQRRGEIRSELDPRTVAVMFVGLFQPAAFLWSLSEGGFDVSRQARDAWPLFRRAIGTEGGAGRRTPRAARTSESRARSMARGRSAAHPSPAKPETRS